MLSPCRLTLAIMLFVLPTMPAMAKDAVHPFDLWQHGALRGANIGESRGDVDLKVLRSWGANVVQFCFPDTCNPESPYEPRPEGFATADELIRQASEAGLYVVIVTFRGPGHAHDDDFRIYHDPAAQEAYARMWRGIAAHYKDNPAVVGYDIMGEPHPGDEFVNQGMSRAEAVRALKGTLGDWTTFSRKITKAIREADSYTPVLVESIGWGYPQLFDFLEPTGDPRTVYVVHFYSPRRFTHQGLPGEPELDGPLPYPGVIPGHVEPDQHWDQKVVEQTLSHVRRFQERHHVPIFAGEFGCVRWAPGATDYLRDTIELFEKWRWSWAYWRFRGSYDTWDIEKLPDRSDASRHQHTPMLDLYRSCFSHNKVFAGPPAAPGPLMPPAASGG